MVFSFTSTFLVVTFLLSSILGCGVTTFFGLLTLVVTFGLTVTFSKVVYLNLTWGNELSGTLNNLYVCLNLD